MKRFFRLPLVLLACAAFAVTGCNDKDPDTGEPEGPTPPKDPVTYVVTVNSHSEEGADIKVVPSQESSYYCGIHSNISLLGLSNEKILKKLALEADLAKMIHTGTAEFTLAQTLTPYESYTIVVAGYDGKEFTGDIDKSQTFTVEPSGGIKDFRFEIKELTYNAATINVIPLDGEMAYFAEVKEAKTCDAMTDEQITTEVINLYGSMADWFTYTGPTTISSGTDFGDLKPDTDYYVFAFGYAGGKASTGIVKLLFHTKAPADPSSNTFQFEVSNIGGRKASVKITPSEPSVLYVWDVITEENYKKYGSNAQAIRNYLADYIQHELSESFPTPEDVISIIGVRGEKVYDFESLNSETTYYIWAVCVDKSGKPMAEPAISDPFTTTKVVVSTATADLGINKFYDGSVLYGIDAKTYKNYNGKAYVPAKLNHSSNAKYWYTIYTVADVSDTSVYTDDILIRNLVSQGTPGGDSRYYPVPWNTIVSFLAVAQDADGEFGPVFRKVMNFDPANVSPVSDLGLTGANPIQQTVSIKSVPIGLRMH